MSELKQYRWYLPFFKFGKNYQPDPVLLLIPSYSFPFSLSFWFPPPGPSSPLLSPFLSVQAVFQSDEYGLPVRHGGSEEPCAQTARELDFPLLLKNQPAITPNITEKQQTSRSFRAWRGRIKLLIPWNLRDLNLQIINSLFSYPIVWCKSISRWLPFLNMMELDGILHILLKYLKTCHHTLTAISLEIIIVVIIHRSCSADFYE